MYEASSEARNKAALASSTRLREAPHRHVHHPPRRLLRVVGVELAQQRRVDRAGAERVDAHAAARELDPELARQRQHAALRRRVGDLRRRRAHHRHERGGVDHRAAAGLQQVRDAVLAAEEDRLQVDVLHPLPRLLGGVEDGGVVGGGDAGVVEQHVDRPELRAHARVQLADLVLVGDVDREREVAGRVVGEVDADDGGALVLEALDARRADPARGAGDDADLAREPAHAPVA